MCWSALTFWDSARFASGGAASVVGTTLFGETNNTTLGPVDLRRIRKKRRLARGSVQNGKSRNRVPKMDQAKRQAVVGIVAEKLRIHSLPRVGGSLLLRPVAGCAKWFGNDVHQPYREHDFNKSFDRIEPFHHKSSEQNPCQ